MVSGLVIPTKNNSKGNSKLNKYKNIEYIKEENLVQDIPYTNSSYNDTTTVCTTTEDIQINVDNRSENSKSQEYTGNSKILPSHIVVPTYVKKLSTSNIGIENTTTVTPDESIYILYGLSKLYKIRENRKVFSKNKYIYINITNGTIIRSSNLNTLLQVTSRYMSYPNIVQQAYFCDGIATNTATATMVEPITISDNNDLSILFCNNIAVIEGNRSNLALSTILSSMSFFFIY